MPAQFITLEGGEGTGKSTQARLLAERLRTAGRKVVLTREPGGSPFAEEVRALILSGRSAPLTPLCEALLFYAARADHLAHTIRPALAAGEWVVCDRFSDSTRVYQGIAGGLEPAVVETLEQLVVGRSVPDLTLLLDIDPRIGLARAGSRRGGTPAAPIEDPYERRDLAFHLRLRAGFLAIARAEPERCAVIDANRAVGEVCSDIWRTVAERQLPEGGC